MNIFLTLYNSTSWSYRESNPIYQNKTDMEYVTAREEYIKFSSKVAAYVTTIEITSLHKKKSSPTHH